MQKLELTWIGKGEEPKLEPRILIHDKEKSYGDENTENMLIHGDNLLALKALEQDYAGKIKCIYIDPPYNTGARINADGEEVGYDDGLEHSEWLCMMEPRLRLLEKLLKDDGTLIVQIDDNEYARLYLLMSEIFGSSKLKTICVKMSEPTGVKMSHVINSGSIPKLKEYLIIAKKDGIKNLFIERIPKDKWDDEYNRYLDGITKDEISLLKKIRDNENRTKVDIEICDKILSKISLRNLTEVYREYNIITEQEKLDFNFNNAWRIVQIASMSGGAKDLADQKRSETKNVFYSIVTPKKKMYFIKGDYDQSVRTPRIKLLIADDYLTVHPGDFWQDIKTTGLDNEGGVDFKKGKKPEALIKRIIEMASNEGDYVLDSFAGSGTTGAVAHKLKRKWIMIEMGPHCYTHTSKRICKVINGEDNQGISNTVHFKGGGGFKFYELAPSLLKKDKYGQFVIDKENYNPEMLASAVAKINGYRYHPDEEVFWKQGKSTESSYIFTTDKYVTAQYVDMLASELAKNERLLICCPAFDSGLNNSYENIILKKIPESVLDKCQFGVQNYNMNIIELDEFDEVEEDEI